MAIGDLYDANGVVVGQAAVFVAASNTPLPALSGWDVNDPFDETFFTGSGFVPVGATEQGWTLGAAKSTQTISIEEQSTPVATTISSQNLTIAGTLSEDITSTLTLAMNATSVSTPATLSTPGYDTVTLQDDPIYYAVAMVTTNFASYPSGSGALSSALSTGGGAITALPLSAPGLSNSLPSGASVTTKDNAGHSQTWVLTASAAAGATSLAVTSQVPNFNYPIGSAVSAVATKSGSLGRIVYAPKWTQLDNVSAAHRRAAAARQYAVSFASVCKTRDIEIINFTAPAL